MLVTSFAAGGSTYTSIVTAGPIEQLTVSDQLNCQVRHSADPQAQIYPSLDEEHGACGTQVAYGGQVYGPADVPGGNDPIDFVPVSQSAVTGEGTVAAPYRIVTTVTAGVLEIAQTDTHVAGQELYRTDITVRNTGSGPASVTLYRFGDCYVHEDDRGYGRVVGPGGIACTTDPAEPRPGMLIWMPLTPGSSYFEGSFETLYGTISSGAPFPSSCDCATLHENAAGLSWTVTIAGGGSASFAHTLQVAPTGTDAIQLPEVGSPAGPLPAVPPPVGAPFPVTGSQSPAATPRAIAETCAKRLAGRSRWKGRLSSTARARSVAVRLKPAKTLRAVRVVLRRSAPCSTRRRAVASARRTTARARRSTTIRLRLPRGVKPGFYVVLVSARQGGRSVRSAAVVRIR